MSSSTLSRRIQLKRLAHVTYQHADIEKARQFLGDFGLRETEQQSNSDKTYYRGYGTEPFVYLAVKGDKDEFLGASFVVDSVDDLELAQQLPNATEIYSLKDAPGGGKCVTFKDPVDGFSFHLVHGQEQREAEDNFWERSYNFPNSKNRPVNKTQRFEKGPAAVHKIGHFGLCVTNFKAMFDFFTSNFTLKPSNMVYDPQTDQDLTTFLHLDRGSEWVDHHTFFFFQGPNAPHVHHSSFEVHDFDQQLLGHHWLAQKKWKSVWGVGRHVLGSQIFDYWWDASGFMVEHYVDGDLVNDETPVERIKGGPESLYVWGPDLPPTFLD